MIKLAIAVEPHQVKAKKSHYKIWFLHLNDQKKVVGIGKMTRTRMVEDLATNYRASGSSGWRAIALGEEKSKKIELCDFIDMNMYQNTHFGSLPTLPQFQQVLKQLQINLEITSIAC